MAIAPTLDALIDTTPRVRGGQPIIAGMGTTVRGVVGLYKLGLDAEEIATHLRHLRHLSLAQVYAALTYYHLHAADIEADIEADSEAALKRRVALSGG